MTLKIRSNRKTLNHSHIMKLTKIVLTVVVWCCFLTTHAQQTAVFEDANTAYKKGVELYDAGVFGGAQEYFGKVLNMQHLSNEPSYEILETKARLRHAQCAIRLEQPDGEQLVLDFIRDNKPSAIANQASMEMGNYYFDQRKYEQALKFYKAVPMAGMSNEAITEMKFKLGYANLVKKKYGKAKALFKQIKDIKGEYYNSSNYYYGITAFQSKDYKTAIKSFELVEKTRKYKKEVPYYIVQIAFAQKDYNKVISFGSDKAKDPNIKKYRDINKLVGQAYFEKKNYKRALPYLETHAEGGRLRQQDFYQVGFTQYKTGSYKKAIDNFKELSNLKNNLGQSALYNLGDCYIKTNDKQSARNAFKKASTMNFDKKIQEEAFFNYAKLSYELKFDNEAIIALQKIPQTSRHYTESQEMLSQVFLGTKNYKKALEIIESIPNQSVKMREAYQQVAYNYGVNLYNDGDARNAKVLFIKSLKNPIDQRTRALATYWVGDINYAEKDHNSSINDFNQFLTISRGIRNADNIFTEEASRHTANYNLGYNYIKKNDYTTAQRYFSEAVKGFEKELSQLRASQIRSSDVLSKIYPDALLRTGDCNFKNNRYKEALTYYDKVIKKRYNGLDYALYQKGLLQGLQGNSVAKIVTLEKLIKTQKNSQYADDALLALGAVHLERGEYEQATKFLRILVTRYKSSTLTNAARLKLGLIAYNQDDADKALDYYKQVVTNNPEPVEAKSALRGIEEIYVDRGEPDKYFKFLETIDGYQVSDLTKDSISFKTAEAQYINGNYEKAIRAYSSYLRQFPNGRSALEARYQRGESHYILKQYNEALLDYENIVGRGTSRYYNRALRKAALISYNAKQDFGKSYNYYSKWVEVAAGLELYEAQLGKMRSAYRLGGKSSEIYSLGSKIINDPSASRQEKAEAQFYVGKTALDAKDLNRAMSAFKEANRLSDNVISAEAYYRIGQIHYLQKNLIVAQDWCLNANAEIGDYEDWLARCIILLADIFSDQGDFFNARASLESIIDNYEGDQTIIDEAKQKLIIVKQKQQSKSRLAPETDDSDDLEMEDGGK